MTVFKNYPEKGDLSRAETTEEEYKRILRKNEEEDQRDLIVTVFFSFNKDPRAEVVALWQSSGTNS